MEIIDKYVYAVTSQLPEKQRKDIETELRGLIEDMLEDAGYAEQPTNEAVEAVLLELGNPKELATKYRGEPQYLISPELFPYYKSVLKIVLTAIAVVMFFVLCIETVFEPDKISNFPMHIGDFIGDAISSIIMSVIQGFAWVTIVFAIIEYTGAKKDVVKNKGGWKLSDLPELPNSKYRIKRSDTIVGLIFSIFFVMLFTFSLNYFGVWLANEKVLDGEMQIIPFFNKEVIMSFLPYIWVLFACTVVLECLKLISGKWTIKLLMLNIAFHVLNLVFAVVFFSNPHIWNENFIDQLALLQIYSEHNDVTKVVTTSWDNVRLISIAITAFIMLGGIASSLYKIWRMRRNE